ncbi:hypothetical protein CKO_04366 [Citrobacter koseri ATCC BAA-895]|uniref:Uncharacterized protein n=1 Tax=Citrobacter koseri (strain ATCC BAA-895 / CDC 4225-83 / SGSC4696) TaxID=290338 RepID=A8APK9_CITK8|nr:hypothetical protein CKO_04366 [Citrobacter koseri ATCC BAA-895]
MTQVVIGYQTYCCDRRVGSGPGALPGVGAATSAMDALSKDE